MPAIRGQSLVIINDLNARITINTHNFGDLTIDVQRTGTGANTTINLILSKNTVLVLQEILANPTIAQVETWISTNVGNIIGEEMQFRIHFFSVNPTISATISCWNAGLIIPDIWWA